MRKLFVPTLLLTTLIAAGCGGPQQPPPDATPPAPPAVEHDHKTVGPHGGALAEWGDHDYHVEFTVDHPAGTAVVYILDGNAKVARPIAATELKLALKLKEPVTITLTPRPQPGDPAGRASAFDARHDAFRSIRVFAGTVSGQFDGKKYSGTLQEVPHSEHDGKKASAQPTPREVDLFLKPGGIYTQADIEKNGGVVPSAKFAGVSFAHDDDLKAGDRVCPVTVNKADEQCTWWVNGKEYQFCCPPCLEKFVKQAKESPEKIKDPSTYIHK